MNSVFTSLDGTKEENRLETIHSTLTSNSMQIEGLHHADYVSKSGSLRDKSNPTSEFLAFARGGTIEPITTSSSESGV